MRTDDVVELRGRDQGPSRPIQSYAVPTGTAPNPVALLWPTAGVYVSPRGYAVYMDRHGVRWRERLFEDTFVLCAPAPCEPSDLIGYERDDDRGFGSATTCFVVGALDGSVAVVDLDERD